MKINQDIKRQKPTVVASSDLLGWLRGKLAEAEQSLRCRETMANPPTISDEELERLKNTPGVNLLQFILPALRCNQIAFQSLFLDLI